MAWNVWVYKFLKDLINLECTSKMAHSFLLQFCSRIACMKDTREIIYSDIVPTFFLDGLFVCLFWLGFLFVFVFLFCWFEFWSGLFCLFVFCKCSCFLLALCFLIILILFLSDSLFTLHVWQSQQGMGTAWKQQPQGSQQEWMQRREGNTLRPS